MSVKVGTFAKATGTGAQAVTGVGLRPKALLLWTTRQTAEGQTDIAFLSFGFSDGTNARSNAVNWRDASGLTADFSQSYTDTAILRLITNNVGSTTINAEASLTSFDADGFTLTWSINDGVASVVHYMAIGGGAEAFAGTLVSPASGSAGQHSYLGVGFAPDLLLFICPDQDHENDSDYTDQASVFTIGAADAVGNQWLTSAMVNGQGARAYQRIDRCVALNQTDASIEEQASHVSMDEDGFTLNWSVVAGNPNHVFYLALRNVNARVGSLTQPTSNGTQATAGLGFAPEAVMFLSQNKAANTVVTDNGRLSIGAGDATSQGGAWIGMPYPGANVPSARSHQTTHAIRLLTEAATGSSSTINAQATLESLDSDGFTANWTTTDATARQVLFLALLVAPEPVAEFTPGGALAGIEGPLLWIELHHPATDDPLVIAPVVLADPATYYHGFKDARVLRVDVVQLALSDRAGRPQANRFSFEMADYIDGDAAPIVRSWLGQINRRALRRVEVVVRMITDAARLQLRRPVTVFRGRIEEYQGLDQYRVRIECLSWGHQRYDKPVLTTKVSDLFANAPAETRDLLLPLALGRLSDEGSTTAAPVIVEDEAGRGSSVDGDEPVSGYGDLAVAAPTTVAAVETTGGNLDLGDQPGNEYVIQATRVVAGVEGNPSPFVPGGLSVVITADNAAIDATCDDDGADAYRFYIGRRFAGGVTFSHYLETDDPVTGVTFTDMPSLASQAFAPITTGGVHAINPFAAAAVLAVMSDGRTVLSAVVFVQSLGYYRPTRFAWTPIVGAEHYEVYWKDAPILSDVAYSRKFVVPASQLNGNGDVYWQYNWSDTGYETVTGAPVPVGKIAPRYIGKYTDLEGFSEWGGFVMSVRPGAAFEAAYIGGVRIPEADYNTLIMAPGKGLYATLFGSDPFITIGSHRLFMVFLRSHFLEAALAAQEDPAIRPATSASATIGEDASAVLIEVEDAGADGNSYTVEVEAGSGTNVPLSAVLTDQALVITLATDGSGNPDDTANAGTSVAALVNTIAGLTAGVTGTGADPVAPQGETAFAGGSDEGQIPGNPYEGEFRVNFSGCDDEDDGTGDVIADIFDQFELLAKHLLLHDTPSVAGAWAGTMPTFADGTARLDAAALTRAKGDHDTLVSSRAAARWIADSITWGQLLAEWALSAGAKTAINEEGQLLVAVRSPHAAVVASVEHTLEIIDRSFTFRDTPRGFATRTPYAYRPVYDVDGGITMGDTGERIAAGIETEFDESPADVLQEYRWRDSAVAAGELAAASLEASQLPPREATAASVLHWLHYPIGRAIAVTHPEGPHASGYVGHKLQILGKRLSPDGCTVALTLDDLRRQVDDPSAAGTYTTSMAVADAMIASRRSMSVAAWPSGGDGPQS